MTAVTLANTLTSAPDVALTGGKLTVTASNSFGIVTTSSGTNFETSSAVSINRLKASGAIKLGGSLDINGGTPDDSFLAGSFTGTATHNINLKTSADLQLRSNFNITRHTITLEPNSVLNVPTSHTAQISGGTVTSSNNAGNAGKITIDSAGTLSINGGTVSSFITNSGTLNVNSDIGHSQRALVSTTGTINYNSASGSITNTFKTNNYGTTNINCAGSNDISFTGSDGVDTGLLTITGGDSCDVNMKLINFSHDVSITDANLVLSAGSGTTFNGDVSVLGSGSFVPRNTLYTIGAAKEFLLDDASDFGGQTFQVDLTANSATLTVESSANNLDIELTTTGSTSGVLNIDGTGTTQVTLSGSGFNSRSPWEFSACNKITVDVADWNVYSNVIQNCPLEFSYDINVKNGGSYTVGSTISETSIYGSFITETGGNFVCTGSFYVNTGDFDARAGATLDFAGCQFYSRDTIIATGATFTDSALFEIEGGTTSFEPLTSTTYNFQSGSDLVHSGGNFNTNGNANFNFQSGTSMDLQQTVTMSGMVTLSSGSSFSNSGAVTFNEKFTMGGTAYIDNDITFRNVAPAFSGDVTFNSGTFYVRSDVSSGTTTVSGGSWTSTSNADFDIRRDFTVTGGSMDLSSVFDLDDDVTFKVSSGASFKTTANTNIGDDGTIRSTGSGSTITMKVNDVGTNAIITADNSGEIFITDWNANDTPDLEATSNGVITISGEANYRNADINLDGGHLVVDGSTEVKIVGSSSISFDNGATLTIAEDAAFNYEISDDTDNDNDGSIILETGSEFTVSRPINFHNDFTLSGFGELTIDNTVNVDDGSIVLSGAECGITVDASFNFNGDSLLSVKNGFVEFKDDVTFPDDSDFTIGDLSSFKFDAIEFTDDADFNVVSGTTTGEGQLYFEGDSDWTVTGSGTEYIADDYVQIDGATALVTNAAKLSIMEDMDIWGGADLTVSSNSELYFGDGDITVGGFFDGDADILISDSKVTLKDTDIDMKWGATITMEGAGTEVEREAKKDKGTITLNLGSLAEVKAPCTVIIEKPIWNLNGGTARNSGSFTYDGQDRNFTGPGCQEYKGYTSASFVKFSNSNVVVEHEGCIIIIDSKLEITDTTFLIKDIGRLELENSNVTISGSVSTFDTDDSGEVWLHSGSSFLLASNVTFSNEFNATRPDHIPIRLDGALWDIQGDLKLTSETIVLVANDSSLLVQSSGSLDILGSSQLLVIDSTVSVDSEVTFKSSNGFNVFNSTASVTSNLIGESNGIASFDNSTYSSTGGEINLIQNSQVQFVNEAEATVNSNFFASDSAGLLVQDSELTITGSVTILDSAAFNLMDFSYATIDGSTVQLTGTDTSGIYLSNGSTLEFVSFTDISATSQSNIEVDASTLLLNSGDLSIENSVAINIINGSTFTIESDGTFAATNTTRLVVDDSSIEFGTGSTITLDKNARFTLSNSASGVLSATTTLNDNSLLTVLSGSQIDLDGSITLNGKALLRGNNADIDLLSGDVDLYDDSDLELNNGSVFDMSGTGKVSLNDISIVAISASSLEIDAESLSMFDDSRITIASAGNILVANGDMTMNDGATLSITSGEIEVTTKDLQVFDSSVITLTGATSSMLVSGGDVFLHNDTETSLSNFARFSMTDGSISCTNNASISLDLSSSFSASSVSSMGDFVDGCELSLESNSQFTVSGTTNFENDASYYLNDATFTSNGQTSFMNNADGTLVSGSEFIINGGLVTFSNDADLFINLNSNFYVNGGSMEQYDTSDITISQTGSLTIKGSLTQYNTSSISLSSNSELVVNGASAVFSSTDDTSVSVSASSSLNVRNGGGISLSDDSMWSVSSSTVNIENNGFYEQFDNSHTDIISSTVDIDGEVTLNQQSFIDASSTFFTISTGGFTALDSTNITLADSSSFVVNQGDVLFTDDAIFYMDSTSVLVVNEGAVSFTNDTQLIADPNSSIDIIGSFSIEDNVCPYFDNVDIVVSGLFHLRDQTCFTLINSDLLIDLDGELATFDDHQLTIVNSNIDLNVGSVLFSGTPVSFVDFTDVALSLIAGNIEVSQDLSFSIDGSSIDIFNGAAIFTDQTNSLWSNSVLSIENTDNIPARLAFQQQSENMFDNTSVTVDGGNVDFENDATATAVDSSFRIVSGELTMSDYTEGDCTNTPFTIDFGLAYMNTNATLYIKDAYFNMTSVGGNFTAVDYACITLDNSPFSVYGGNVDFNDDACMTATDSPILVDSGSVVFSHDTSLSLTTPLTTFTVNSGNFLLENTAEFNTVQGTQIDIFGGNFGVSGGVQLDFDQVDMFVGGNINLSNYAEIHLLQSTIDIDGGTFTTVDDTVVSLDSSDISVTSGNFVTRNNVEFSMVSSNLVVGGDVVFDGTALSQHTIEDSSITINTGGDLYVTSNVHLQTNNTNTVINGGNFELDTNARLTAGQTSFTLDGTGTLKASSNARLLFTDNSVVEVITNGATATFEDNVRVDFEDLSTFNVTGGSVEYSGTSRVNLFEGTFFNVLGGSFTMSGSSNLVAYPFTSGTIAAGDFHIYDFACVTFIQSNISIQGELSSNSDCPVNFLANSTLFVEGNINLGGATVLNVNGETFLHVLDGSISLHDTACIIINDTGRALVSGGSILAYDYSCIVVSNNASFSVTGGNVTTYDFSTFHVVNNSVLTVSTNGTIGNVFVQGNSYMEISENSNLFVIGGNLQISEYGQFMSTNAIVRVIDGDLVLLDYADVDILANTLLEVLDGGNFESSGVGVELSFHRADTRVAGGDFIAAMRSQIIATQSTFEISGNGNVLLTDISRTFFSEQTTMQIFGGGNLELFRSANLFLEDSSITIDDAGSIFANADASLELVVNSVVTVTDGGSIVFNDDSLLIALSNSVASVNGGGNILFLDSSSTLVKENSEFSVTGSGSIIFSGNSYTEVLDGSIFFVDDGGNIEYSDQSYLYASASFLSVEGGGSIIFRGNGENNIENNSILTVAGGNIEFFDTRVVNMNDSSLVITSGDLLTHDDVIFTLETSSASISGGNFISNGNSIININPTSFMDISGGNVELNNNGNVNMNAATITVTSTGSTTGFFSVSDSVEVLLESNSLISVTGGDFVNDGNSIINAIESEINISSGSILSSGSSEVDMSNGSVIVSGGSLRLSDFSAWNFASDSTASISGGSVSLSDSSVMNMLISTLNISEGDLSLDGSSNLDMDNSVIQVSGGNVLFAASSTFTGDQSDFTVTCGRVIYDDNSEFQISTTHIIVNSGNCDASSLSARLPSPIGENDVIIVGGYAKFISSQQSIIDIIEGNFVFVEFGTSIITDTIINISGGNLHLRGNTNTQFSGSQITISSGLLQISESASVLVEDSSRISIVGGDLLSEGDIIFTVQSSFITINEGSASFTDGNINFASSIVQILESGSLFFGGSSVVDITSESSLSLSGSGVFEITDSTIFNVHQSTLSVSEGTFIANGNTVITIASSEYSITGGDTTYGGNTQIQVESSTFTIQGGNVLFTDNSQFTLSSDSIYQVLGGNVLTEGSSILQLSGSCFTISQGSVEYADNNILRLENNACWNVTGGNVLLRNNVQYSLNSQSTLNIEEGSFYAENSVQFSVDDAHVSISGGSFELADQSFFTLSNGASVEVSEGNAIFSGAITSRVSDSDFTVSGGYVEFSGKADLEWRTSTLDITSGDMLIYGESIVSFIDSSINVAGGSLKFREKSQVTITSSVLDIFIGSVNFIGNAIVAITDSTVSIREGDLQFANEASVTFTNTPIQLEGQLEFLDNANTHFVNSDVTILTGSFHAKDHSNVFFEQCMLDIAGGSLHAQNFADVRIEDSRITISNGDLRINDQGSFNMHRSSLVIESGNFIANNPNNERKYLTFTNSVISVENHSANGNTLLNGNMELHSNVEMSLLSSDVVVDGNLVLTGTARMNIFEESSFNIPTGVVKMDATSSIVIDGKSSLLNQGQLVAPGSLRAPSDSSMDNQGILETDNDLNSNCFADLSNGAPLVNSGVFRLGSADRSNALQACVDQLQHSGILQLGKTNMTFNLVQTTSESLITLAGAQVGVSSGSPFESNGNLGGTGSFGGSLSNTGDATIMANGETGTTLINVDEDFSSSGTVFFSINSRDLSDPDAITQINAGRNVHLQGGNACICFNPNLELEEGDRFDLVNAQTLLDGVFDSVEFDCVACPRRNSKSLEATNAACEPSADYGGTNFAVLLGSCGSNDNPLETISPPWYVIFPVSIGIIAIIVVVFGGALFIEERYRKKKFEQKVARKRSARVKKFVDETKRSRSATASASASIN